MGCRLESSSSMRKDLPNLGQKKTGGEVVRIDGRASIWDSPGEGKREREMEKQKKG